MPFDSPLFPGCFELLVPLFENYLVLAGQFVPRGYEADRAVKPDGVVVFDVLCHKPPGVVKGKRRLGSDAFSFECFVEAFELPVRLWIVRRCPHMRHAGQPDELLEVLGDELRPVVRDDPRPGFRKLLLGPFEDDLNVRFQHPLPDLPMDDEAAAAVQNAAEVVKRAAKVQVRYIDMPVLVRQERLNESGSLLAWVLVPLIQQACLRKNAPGARGAYRNDVPIQHHEREPPVAFQRVIVIETDDGLAFPFFQPEIARNGGIVLIGLAVPVDPRVELALADGKPVHEPLHRDIGPSGPGPGEINDGVSRIMGNPDAG